MIAPISSKTTKAGTKPASTKIAKGETPRPVIELPGGIWERVAQKAHELWEQRGRQDGQDLQDWLDAEEIVIEEIHEARE